MDSGDLGCGTYGGCWMMPIGTPIVLSIMGSITCFVCFGSSCRNLKLRVISHVRQLMVSRFLSEAGQQALTYGVLISVVRGGGNALDAALVGIAGLLPPALLGMHGGAVADALPKRLALAFAYNVPSGALLFGGVCGGDGFGAAVNSGFWCQHYGGNYPGRRSPRFCLSSLRKISWLVRRL